MPAACNGAHGSIGTTGGPTGTLMRCSLQGLSRLGEKQKAPAYVWLAPIQYEDISEEGSYAFHGLKEAAANE